MKKEELINELAKTLEIEIDKSDIEPESELLVEKLVQEYVEVEMRTWKIQYFLNPHKIKLEPESYAVVEVDRGYDIGKIMHTSLKGKEYDDLFEQGKVSAIIRSVTASDIRNLEQIQDRERLATERFSELKSKYPFEMKLIDTVYQFDGNKLTFFFTAEGRVDFREFVRELAQVFKTRIELHQCTGRDEAKKLGGYGMCGKSFCCSTYMKRFNQVTIKMAKDQNLSGNHSKISGPCGRLLCCLHYEEDFYTEMAKDYPEMGEEVEIEGDKMYVFRNDMYAKKVYLTSDKQEIKSIPLEQYNQLLRKRK